MAAALRARAMPQLSAQPLLTGRPGIPEPARVTEKRNAASKYAQSADPFGTELPAEVPEKISHCGAQRSYLNKAVQLQES